MERVAGSRGTSGASPRAVALPDRGAHPTPPRSEAEDIDREPNPLKRVLRMIGPGLVTGAAQADPSAIGTYAVAGATIGLPVLWTALFSLPLVAATENICARLGLVSKTGLAGIIRRRYPKPVLYAAVALLSIATTVNIGADLGAVADSLHLLSGLPALALIPPVTIVILAFVIFGSYKLISTALKMLTLALLAYVLDAFVLRPDLGTIAAATLVPRLSLDREYVQVLVAIFGTTISPYLFFWQSDEEVEEKREEAEAYGRQAERATAADVTHATVDVTSGMSASNVIMFFIIMSTALTLHAQHDTDIKSGADAAAALRPLLGDLAGALFAVGMIGAGLLAVPVLSGATAYALGETFGWRAGLDEKWYRAKPFYAVIAVATLVGVGINFTGVNPIDALFLTSLMMGAVAPPLLVLVMLAARDPAVMGERRIGPVLTAVGWLAVAVTFAVLAGLVYETFAAT